MIRCGVKICRKTLHVNVVSICVQRAGKGKIIFDIRHPSPSKGLVMTE